ncbi:IQ domain-containing protein [Striga asiatica]|uniref:IQ domain-containing protein n=1 Tax=Striga asiatica TaxID=4170 RepID=A0A5A7QY71_STRAF|nr:IQ domain-containing protein [Striga asiatica]
MGRKGNWLSSVKKALSPNTKEKKAKKADKSKKKWFGNENPLVSEPLNQEAAQASSHPPTLPPLENVKLAEIEDEQTKNADDDVAVETVSVEEIATKVVRLSKPSQFAGKSAEEIAVIKIQTAFRGYLARRALRALRGLVRLKSLVDGPTAKRQTASTLKCMQTLSRVQSQIQSRRLRMLEENRALQRQLLQNRAKELESLRLGEEWDDSVQSKEQIEANLLHKFEAAMRRERALAYSYTHQQTWKKSSKPTNLLFMDPTNPHWGWSWLERWMPAVTTPLDNSQIALDKENNIKTPSGLGDITKSFARHQLSNSEPNPSSSPTTLKKPPLTPKSSTSKKIKLPISQDDESRSTFSMKSERINRRHTIGGGSSIRDDESLTSSQTLPSYMVPTQSARAKLRLSSPLGMENGGFNNNDDDNNNNNNNSNSNTPKKGSAKKRLSFPPSPARGRRNPGVQKSDL